VTDLTLELREQFLNEGPFLRRSHGGEHLTAVVERHVNGGLTHTTRTGVNQDGLASLQLTHHYLSEKNIRVIFHISVASVGWVTKNLSSRAPPAF
jgi:hypothetical protein